MSLATGWHRLEAARWVHRLLMLIAVLYGLLTAASLVLSLSAGMPALALIPLAFTVFTGWLAHAWDTGRPWTWWTTTLLTAVFVAGGLLQIVSRPGILPLVALLIDVPLLVLLLHPDSSARLDGTPAR